MEKSVNVPQWYAVYTKPHEEERAYQNLAGWGVEAFYPKVRKKRAAQFEGTPVYLSRPLFTRYIFARFDAETMLHKIHYTRGVDSVVSFNMTPLAVSDEIIDLIKSKVGEDGFVSLGDEMKRGDKVWVTNSAAEKIEGVFDRTMNDKGRVMILLTTINYQARLIVDGGQVRKSGVSLHAF